MNKQSEKHLQRNAALRITSSVVGIASIVAGVITLWILSSNITGVTITLGIYAIVAGFAYLYLTVAGRGMLNWVRGGHALVGIAYIAAGVLALVNQSTSSTDIALILTTVIASVWIVEGLLAVFSKIRGTESWWALPFGAVSVLTGAIVLIAPIWAEGSMWAYLGVSLIVLGLTQALRALLAKPTKK